MSTSGGIVTEAIFETVDRRALRPTFQARLPRGDDAVLAAAAVVAFSAVFLVFPGLDMAVSGLFHRPADGFFLAGDPMLMALRRSSTFVVVAMLAVPLARWLWRTTRGRNGRRAGRQALFLLFGLALGPGLVVNLLFKEVWGRARPIQIEAFGGRAPFTPAWAPSDACVSNCSFVSGEGAAAAWMVGAAVILVPARLRPLLLPPMIAYATMLSVNRIAFGGHFLSDVLLSWALTVLALIALHRAMKTLPALAWGRRGLQARASAIA